MYKASQLGLFVLCHLIAVPVSAEDCIYQECDCAGTDVFCSGRGLTMVPPKVDTFTDPVDDLDLNGNKITRIPAGSLPPNLKHISLIEVPLTAIDDTAFDDSANTLESITLSGADFIKLPDAFLHLKHMKSLIIYDSTIADWNVDAMMNIGRTINIFSVQNCSLNVWPVWVQHLSNLTELTLSSNGIASVPDGALDNVTHSLTKLVLANNNLTTVPRALSQLSVLELLDLKENRISDVSWLPQASKLVTLSLYMNTIFDADQLSQALLPYGDSLSELDIGSNQLSSVPNLGILTQIENLDFSYNIISDPTSGSLPNELSLLNFQNNKLPSIPKVMLSVKYVSYMVLLNNEILEIQAVDFPVWIQGVEMGYNLITELTDTSFPENSSLYFLHLNNNPISEISNNAFTNLPLLSVIDLRYTNLSRLPLGLALSTKLYHLDFTGTTSLVCTCQEKALQSRILSMLPEHVLGDCGVAGIYDFFSTLSQACSANPSDLR